MKPFIVVERSVVASNYQATVGTLRVHNEEGEVIFTCATLELPWLDNAPNVSCIHADEYDIFLRDVSWSNFKYPHLGLVDKNGRSVVLMHVANFTRQLEGCIALGDKHTDIDGDGITDVTNSRKTFTEFMDVMTPIMQDHGQIKLKVIWTQN